MKLSALTALCLAVMTLPAAAPAQTPAGATRPAASDATTSLEQLRQDAGLPAVAVNQDPGLDTLLEQYLAAIEALPKDGPSEEPEGLVACGCYLYEQAGADWRFISPSEFAAAQGRPGSYGAWIFEEGDLDRLPADSGQELLLDSRLTALAGHVHTFLNGAQRLVIFAQLADGPAKIRSARSVLDAREANRLVFTSPADMGRFRIELRSGGQWLTKYAGRLPDSMSTYPGFAGLRLNVFADDDEAREQVRLAWDARYRIVGADQSAEFRTAAVAPPRKGWVFAKSMTARYRRIFYAAIARMAPSYRALLSQIAPYTRVKTHSGSGISLAFPYDSSVGNKKLPFEVSFARGHLAMKNFRAEVVAHELAHILDYSGLDDQGYSQFLKRFKRSRAWRRCSGRQPPSEFPRWPCLADTELIADQLAYAALNRRSGLGGYGDPRLISARSMLRLLRRYYHFTNPYDGYLLTDPQWRDVGPEPASTARVERPISDPLQPLS